jgi:hypothetical protein
MSLPPSLKRGSARSTANRESALLDNFEMVREIEAGCLSNPSAYDLIDSAKKLGMEAHTLAADAEANKRVWAIQNGDVVVAILVSVGGCNDLYPSENAW